jgi:3-oxoacyl-[acyl-carrier protein] reductase
MISRKSGKIINISSVWGNVGASCEVAYSATKGAVNSITKALAKEVAPSNIQVNAVAFGMVDTRMNQRLTSEDLDSLKEDIPANRIMNTREAATAVMKVLEMPEYMTGQIITVDGGWI